MKLHEALAATFAAIGQDISDVALALIARDLAPYPLADVFKSLSRCRKELRRIALVDILDRLPGGHPGPEEAWAIVSRALTDERISVVWTEEICQAFFAAQNLSDDPVAARMAFKEAYAGLVANSREERNPIVWKASLGHDPQGREPVLMEAVEKGRLSAQHVAGLIPHNEDACAKLLGMIEVKRLGGVAA